MKPLWVAGSAVAFHQKLMVRSSLLQWPSPCVILRQVIRKRVVTVTHNFTEFDREVKTRKIDVEKHLVRLRSFLLVMENETGTKGQYKLLLTA